MNQPTSRSAPVPEDDPPSTSQVVRDDAVEVGRSAADETRRVASTAADQAQGIAREAQNQARGLLDDARAQLTEQARAGQQQVSDTLHTLGAELRQMAHSGGRRPGPAADLAGQCAGYAQDAAGWLDRHEPRDLVAQARRAARRHPGTFLVGAALAGALLGRLTRGAVDAHRDEQDGTDPAPDPAPVAAARPDPPPPAVPGRPDDPPVAPVDRQPPPPPSGSSTPWAGSAARAGTAPVPEQLWSGPERSWPAQEGPPGHDGTTVGEYVEHLQRRAADPAHPEHGR